MGRPDRHLLGAQWSEVARALGITIESPFTIDIADGKSLEFALLLPQFGGPKGMLVDTTYERAVVSVAMDAGYAVSTMGPETRLPVDPENYIDCLVDWGWADMTEAAPDWYVDALRDAV